MRSNLKKVFIVFKTHFDIGYTHLASELLEWYSDSMIKDVVQVCSATRNNPEGRKYVWTVPSWPLKKILEGIKDAEFKNTVENFIRVRQLIWHGLPFTTHTEFCGLEEFIRGLYTARELSAEFGCWTADAKMTDVPGHTWILPTILAKAGIKFIHLGCNFCATPPDVPRLFFWEGPDGGRVLTYYSKGDYGTDLIPPEDWDYPYWLAMLQTLDNLGAQDTSYLNKLFERAEKELPYTEVCIGSLGDFGKAMLEEGCDIPVIRGDLADTWIRGVGSAPSGVSKVRGLRPLLSTLESVTSFKSMTCLYKSTEGKEADIKTVAGCYEKMLLFGEHTWSMDTKVTILPERCYGAPWIGFKFWESGVYSKETFDDLKENNPGYLRLKESWQEQLNYLTDAEKGIEALKEGALHDLAASVDVSGDRLVIAGNLGRKGIASVVLEGLLPKDMEVKYLEEPGNHEMIPVYINHEGKKTADITMPALGYKTLIVTQGIRSNACLNEIPQIASVDGVIGILENKFLRIEADSLTGCIKSLYHKPMDKEWVNGQSKFGFGQYVYDIYSSKELNKYLCDYSYVLRDWGVNDLGKAGYPKEQQHLSFSIYNFDIKAENGFNWGKIALTAKIDNVSSFKYGNAASIKTTLTVYADREYIDIRFDLIGKNETPLIESGHFAFPLALENPKYRLNKLGSIIDPEKDILHSCNKDLHCIEKWVDICDGKWGMAVIPLDMPLFSFNEPGVLKFDRDFKLQEPTLLMQAFNNGWGTNFPQWIGGDFSFRYRLIPHKGDWKDGEVWKKAEETVKKPVVAFSREKEGNIKIPPTYDILAEDLDGFTVLAFKPAEDRQGYILRIGEAKGSARKVKVKFDLPITEVWLCDLIERKLLKLPVVQNSDDILIDFSTEAFEIHTFYVKLRTK